MSATLRRINHITLLVLLLAACVVSAQVPHKKKISHYRPNLDAHHKAFIAATSDPDGRVQDAAGQIVDIFSQLTHQENSAGNPWLRQAHAKQHGCVQAYVQPLNNLPAHLAQGVFAQPVQYPAFIRFSNGVGRGFTALLHANESDIVPDIRGLGIKLLNVSGPFQIPNVDTQVFTLTTARQTFLDNADHALSFFKAVQSGNLATTAWLATHPSLAILYLAQAVVIPSLLTHEWTSPVPQMHGPYIVKHHMYPCDSRATTRRDIRGERANFDFNYLRELLQEDLSANNACFRWAVQFYENDQTTPVNDPTVEWMTPFQDIAVVTIPTQSSWGYNQDNFCRFMSFNPGSTIAAHSPIGPIPTIRNAVYEAMANLRHQLKHQPNRDVTYQDWEDYPNMG